MKHRPPPSKGDQRRDRYEKLLVAIGVGECSDVFDRYALEQALQHLRSDYARRIALLNRLPTRALAHRYHGAIEKAVTLAKAVGPDFLTEIELESWIRQNPKADPGALHIAIGESNIKLRDWIAELENHELDLDHWLKATGDAYKKRDVRKLIVEPFLQLLATQEIKTSRKQLPRSRMFKALFDWLDVQKKFRLSNAAINNIARELEGAAIVEKSNARRRPRK